MAALPAFLLLATAPADAQSLPPPQTESCVGVQIAENAAPAPNRIKPAVPNAAAATIPTGGDEALVAKLKKGGYILYFRHALTNWNEKDQNDPTLSNRALQRNLSEAGQREAATLGQAIKVLDIPIEKVLASPFWRCRDTAQFAFGEYDTTGLLYWKGPKFRDARVKMLSTAPASGKNLVLVGHQDQLIPIIPGLKRDQLQEGDALIIKPEGKGKYKVVRQVSPFDWARLADVAPPAPPDEVPGSMPATPQDTTGVKVIDKN